MVTDRATELPTDTPREEACRPDAPPAVRPPPAPALRIRTGLLGPGPSSLSAPRPAARLGATWHRNGTREHETRCSPTGGWLPCADGVTMRAGDPGPLQPWRGHVEEGDGGGWLWPQDLGLRVGLSAVGDLGTVACSERGAREQVTWGQEAAGGWCPG